MDFLSFATDEILETFYQLLVFLLSDCISVFLRIELVVKQRLVHPDPLQAQHQTASQAGQRENSHGGEGLVQSVVIQPAAGWASHDGDAAEAAVLEGCEAPFVPDDSAMVTVHGLDIGVGLLQRRGLDLDHLLRQLWPVRVMALHISMSRSMVARAVMSSRVSRGVMRSIRASVS